MIINGERHDQAQLAAHLNTMFYKTEVGAAINELSFLKSCNPFTAANQHR